LEPLEDRLLPVVTGGIITPVVGPYVVSGLVQVGSKLSAGATSPIRVTINQNASETVIDLGAVFCTMNNFRASEGLRLSVLSNTNSGLVRTDLSEAALTLTYVRGKCGTATIVVGATDADGLSTKLTIMVMVRPAGTLGPVSVTPTPAGTSVSMSPGMPR
jgi:hypothetical protein